MTTRRREFGDAVAPGDAVTFQVFRESDDRELDVRIIAVERVFY